ncbi:tRNA (adenosine(37)-N6)-dimethylallyltransferase MiaA [Altererythrobacter salegens]|uniref:tRNA dimethylallyltransferase n=1 Tax=Croceibacterium salegens TaxID=1737568 RepID=A0A6I4SWP1_9SPHN|nr:tRNA (adenosine(37)-N6)-dimethylallyltransferase MiaA [Croceibacterium salegens]MXO58762.1 tRNA (adenosine(37)-N6)-dimethylallyltransferase MiaA [Croceibacterium salegens]
MSKGDVSKKPVALIAGPTASGKSDLAVELALALDRPAVVINADSAQVYRDLRVLSARPSEEEMRGIPHRLFGAWDGTEPCSAADWAARAKREIEDAHLAGQVPILVGGTGLYIRTLLDGIAPVPEIAPEVRAATRALPVAEAYAALAIEDCERAAVLKPADTTRVARALEVVRSTGKPLAYWQQQRLGGIGDGIDLHPLLLLPPREWLYERCDRRFALMLERGAEEEVEALLERALPAASPVMRAIGVPEIAGMVRGEWSKDEAMAMGQQATRNYAKRQYTWFRRQPPQDWPRCETEKCSIEEYFERLFAF